MDFHHDRLNGRNINGEYKIILDNKILFEEIFRNYIKVPENYAFILNKNIYGLHENHINNHNIINFIMEKKIVVLKLLGGAEGRGVFIIKYIEDNKFDVNGNIENTEELIKLIETANNSIICEYMHQSDFESELYSKSTNTLRIVCAKENGEKETKIIKAVQRIGSIKSVPVDNLSSGGFASEINITTGILGPAIQKCRETIEIVKYAKHPENNAQIEGKVIPNWDKIKKDITELTNKFPYLNFVAWDVLLTNDGICVIEGNASSGCGLFQLEHGIRNEKYGEILRSYRILE